MDLGNALLSIENHTIKCDRDLFNLFIILDLVRNAESADIQRDMDLIIFDETECGARLQFNSKGFHVNCIVEGSNAEFSERFFYPVQSHGLGEHLCDLTARAHDAWCEAKQDMVQG